MNDIESGINSDGTSSSCETLEGLELKQDNNEQPIQDNNDVIIEKNINDFWEANSESESDDDETGNKTSFLKLKKKIHKNFDVTLLHKYSSALDILASYINCHITIYSEASYYCSFKLNLFMLPCIFFSTLCSVLTSFGHDSREIVISISGLNGLIAFLLAIINYLKLDACSEAHKISAYQYSKLKNYIEFSSGEVLLFQDPLISRRDYINDFINSWEESNCVTNFDTENDYQNEKNKIRNELYSKKNNLEKELIKNIQNKIIEIKKTLKNIEDNNNFILPKHIYLRYSNIYNVNVFSYIKSFDSYKLVILNQLRNVKNEIKYYKLQHKNNREKIVMLYEKKNEILEEFFELNKGFNLIDMMFQQEIKNINLYKTFWYLFLLQKILNIITKCCNIKINILPKYYKKCTHVGYVSKSGEYLLEKILHGACV